MFVQHLARANSKETWKVQVTIAFEGNPHRCIPHKGTVTWKMFPFDNVTITRAWGAMSEHLYRIVRDNVYKSLWPSESKFTTRHYSHISKSIPIFLWVTLKFCKKNLSSRNTLSLIIYWGHHYIFNQFVRIDYSAAGGQQPKTLT